MTMGIWYEAIMRWAGHANHVTAFAKTFVKMRRDQEGILPESPEEVAWIREQVAIGLASGICEKDAFEVLDEIRASREARRG